MREGAEVAVFDLHLDKAQEVVEAKSPSRRKGPRDRVRRGLLRPGRPRVSPRRIGNSAASTSW